MTKNKFPKSLRKHIRVQKAKIRKEITDPLKQSERIAQMIETFGSKKETKK